MVLANPAASVRTVSACTRRGPYHAVSAANAGGKNGPAVATPAASHAPRNQPNDGAAAIPRDRRGAQHAAGRHDQARPVLLQDAPGRDAGERPGQVPRRIGCRS